VLDETACALCLGAGTKLFLFVTIVGERTDTAVPIYVHCSRSVQGGPMIIDPWEKAAECDRAIRACSDRKRKPMLISLRRQWIAVGKEKAAGIIDWYIHAEEVDELHTNIVRSLH
jgi:hypothetical protein